MSNEWFPVFCFQIKLEHNDGSKGEWVTNKSFLKESEAVEKSRQTPHNVKTRILEFVGIRDGNSVILLKEKTRISASTLFKE